MTEARREADGSYAPTPHRAPNDTRQEGNPLKTNHHSDTQNGRVHRALHWIARRRDLMMTSALRGTCYGIGAGGVGLLFWWGEQSL